MKEAITVSQFRKSLRDCFNDALRGEPVVVERGGVRFVLAAEVVAFQEPRGASAATAVKVDKILKERTPSIAPSTPVVSAKDTKKMDEPGAITPAIKASEVFAFCKHGAVIGFCKRGCR